jgi:NMD protein affecting ribosome stability and mRNA decay
MSKHAEPSLYPEREFKQPDKGPTYCPECHAVHEKKRWFLDQDTYRRMVKKGVKPEVCEGCAMVSQGLYNGQLEIDWKRLQTDTAQKDQLLALVRHQEAEEREKNPLSRIVSIEEQDGKIEILTTTKFLATRLGHAIDHAYNGLLKIVHSERGTLARVSWQRE